ncbi:MAG TPA: FecR family protein [Bacteroidales bacterium]|nr:FecR family protein [Bacteroidales bacterium]
MEEKIMARSSALEIPKGKTKEQALQEFKQSLSEKKNISPKRKFSFSYLLITSAAAIILILITISIFVPKLSLTKIKTDNGIQTEIMLPDGSMVKMNAASKITYKKGSFIGDRKLILKGEAFFDVAKGGAFIIETPNGSIKVLGTTFNVYSRESILRVSCLTGKVLVYTGDRKETIDAGQTFELLNSKLNVYTDSKTKYTIGWIDGEFYFENTPLNIVFDEVERQFDVKFASRPREAKYFTGSFTNKEPLLETLESICEVMNLDYEIHGNEKIFISVKK